MDHAPLRSPETLGILIEVRQSAGKGYGVFTLHETPPGTVLLSEAPLVTLVDTGTRADPLDIAVHALPPSRRKAYRSLHSYRRNPSESLNRSILYSNGFATGELASGVFEIASRINHSCIPNSEHVWDDQQGRIIFRNRVVLLAGQEVTVDYGHKKEYLAKFYGFECDCEACRMPQVSVTNGSLQEKPQEVMPITGSIVFDTPGMKEAS